jgi:hypothetical protein
MLALHGSHYFQDSQRRIIESDISPKVRGFFSSYQQNKVITEALKKYTESSLRFFKSTVPGVSKVLSNVQCVKSSSKLSHSSIFLFKLLTNSLPTIALQFKLNQAKFPLLYPSNTCVLCASQSVESIYHALCFCPAMIAFRNQAFGKFESRIRSTVPALFSSPLPMSFLDFFTSEVSFQRGLIPSTFHSVFLDNQRVELTRDDFTKLKSVLQLGLLNCLHSIWEERNKLVNQNRWSFGARLRTIYGVRKVTFLDAVKTADDVGPRRLTPINLQWTRQQRRSVRVCRQRPGLSVPVA